MPAGKRRDRELIAKIRSRPADKLVEVEDFVDFLGSASRSAGSQRPWPGLRKRRSRRSGTTRTMPRMTAFQFGDVKRKRAILS
jgi:hypothetical protein